MTQEQLMRIVLLLLIISSSDLAQAEVQKQSALPMLGADSARDQIELTGIMVLGGHAYAAISFAKGPAQWMSVGDALVMYRIAGIDENSVHFVGRGGGSEFTRYLSYGKTNSLDASPGPKKFTKAWINSKDNPMLLHATSLPMDLAMNWARLDPKQQQEIIDYYVKHGWRLKFTTTEDGITSGFVWDNIYDTERREVLKQNLTSFRASLSETQRAAWDAIKTSAPFKAAGAGLTPEDLAVISYRRDRYAKFERSLSETQRDTLKNLSDFTRHDWSK